VYFSALHIQIIMEILYLKDVFIFVPKVLMLKMIRDYANKHVLSGNMQIIIQEDVFLNVQLNLKELIKIIITNYVLEFVQIFIGHKI
jgi:hypothetical protein